MFVYHLRHKVMWFARLVHSNLYRIDVDRHHDASLERQRDKSFENVFVVENIIIWAAPSEFGTYRLCEQRRFRRACASAQSRQNLRYSLIQAVSQEEPSDRKPDPWPLWMSGHAQLKFVMTDCSKTQIRLTGLVLSLIFTCILDYSNIMVIKDKYWFFRFAFIHPVCYFREWILLRTQAGVSIFIRRINFYPLDQDQDSLLVKRRNDNHSPGPVIRELVPSSHQRSELSNTILCIFSEWDQRIGIPIPDSLGEEATFINICISNASLKCHRVLISITPSFVDKVIC